MKNNRAGWRTHAPALLAPSSSRMLRPVFAGILILQAVVVACVFWPVLGSSALALDDQQYFAKNPYVQSPSWASVRTFFGEVLQPSTVEGYYHPLTMLSLMCDSAMGGRGDRLGPYHASSLALHLVNVALVSIILLVLFGHPVAAGLLGLAFGLHPVMVESVAWITERKTLLAGTFSFAAILAHIQFARHGGWRAAVVTCAGYTVACLSKPTAVPLPLLLLVIDFWPLRRVGRRALLEKAPLLIMGVAFATLTVVSQGRSGTSGLRGQDAGEALLRSLYLVGFYLRKIVWPGDLCGFFTAPTPMRLSNPTVSVLVATAFAAVLVAVFLQLRGRRAPLAGLAFLCIGVSPTLGHIRFGMADAADKYLYLPILGALLVFAGLVIAWLGPAAAPVRTRRDVLLAIMLLLLGAETLATRRGLAAWRDTDSLLRHQLGITPNNGRLRSYLGVTLLERGETQEARKQLEQARAHAPADTVVLYNLATFEQMQGNFPRAIELYEAVLLGDPNDAQSWHNLGTALAATGRWVEARTAFERALRAAPNFPEAHANYAAILERSGQDRQTVSHWRRAIAVPQPDPNALGRLAKLLLSSRDQSLRNPEEAVSLAERARELSRRRNPDLLETLARAYAGVGRFSDAARVASVALGIYVQRGDGAAARSMEEAIARYRAGMP